MRNLLLAYFICANINLAILNNDDNVKGLGVNGRASDRDRDGDEDEYNENEGPPDNVNNTQSEKNCWMTLNTPHLFKTMDAIDDRYKDIRKKAQKSLMSTEFEQAMLRGFVKSKGAAQREAHRLTHTSWTIPSGINFGGQCMTRMTDSLLFFHRMKLRNNTRFRVTGIHNDISNLVVFINLDLNDLHLQGAYDRTLTDTDPSVLIYAPSFGEVEFLLKNVKYRMEGRYRIIEKHLNIELVTSAISVKEILMTYITQAIESASITVERDTLGAFMDRLQNDLNMWMKDYFNDYLITVEIDGIDHMKEMVKYDKEKSIALQEYMDESIDLIKARVQKLRAQVIKIPNFTLKSIHGLEIKLYDGALHGLDSMYRRSVATGFKIYGLRKVDAIVGFSSLNVVYKYEAMIPTGIPPLSGELTMTANEMAAHLALTAVVDPETVDLDINFLDAMKPGSLTVEGPANTLISNFKHLLEHEILTLMSTSLKHGIGLLRSLPRCSPSIPSKLVTVKPSDSNRLLNFPSEDDMDDDRSRLNNDNNANDDDEQLRLEDEDSENFAIRAKKNKPKKAIVRSKNKKKVIKMQRKISKKN
ncbi:unnamed protein product [Spodoptera littoralis]|uniref:Uncharacterized protein n=1 Tax=Spodoptera littoralis TaxID=7109 RepID=A0A9P0HZG5_SPOLI|nr:unnamed protein product [Spodoptera littoralis]CAH1638319.1 unnamed protein product [Spodoptera littoralis]